MTSPPPLPELLSQVLVALTIELDNEHETRLASTWARPFKTSYVMWANLLRFVPVDGTTAGEVAARTAQPLKSLASTIGGMERWNCLAVDDGPGRPGYGTARGVKATTELRPTATGVVVHQQWEPLPTEIETRWRRRLGDETVDELRAAAAAIASRVEGALPPSVPVLHSSGLPCAPAVDREAAAGPPDDDLHAMLSLVLVAWTLEHEAGAPVSLAIGANVLRVLGDEATAVKDLPLNAGVSKEAVATSLTWLGKHRLVTVEARHAATTAAGRAAQDERVSRNAEVEAAWCDRFGRADVERLRAALVDILDRPGGERGDLSAGLVPSPASWRARGRYRPLTAAFVEHPRRRLPRHPMVLHRGGWPDGS